MAETAVETKKGSGFLSKQDVKLLKDPLHSDNPITIQVLGICSALAVTGSVTKSLVMATRKYAEKERKQVMYTLLQKSM